MRVPVLCGVFLDCAATVSRRCGVGVSIGGRVVSDPSSALCVLLRCLHKSLCKQSCFCVCVLSRSASVCLCVAFHMVVLFCACSLRVVVASRRRVFDPPLTALPSFTGNEGGVGGNSRSCCRSCSCSGSERPARQSRAGATRVQVAAVWRQVVRRRGACRRAGVVLPLVRRAVDFVLVFPGSDHPLLSHRLESLSEPFSPTPGADDAGGAVGGDGTPITQRQVWFARMFSDQRFSCCSEDDRWSPGYAGSQVRPLRWQTYKTMQFSPVATMRTLAGQRLVFVGRSIARQLVVGLLCAMESEGYTVDTVWDDDPASPPFMAHHVHIARVSRRGKYFDVSVFNTATINATDIQSLLRALDDRDFVAIAAGAHYRAPLHLQLLLDMEAVAPLLQQFQDRGGTVALMDTFFTHFPTKDNSGLFSSYDRDCAGAAGRVSSRCMCQPISRYSKAHNPGFVASTQMFVAHKYNLPFVPMADVMKDRHDAHLEFRLKYTCDETGACNADAAPFYVDCRHFCQRPTVFNPVLGRLQAVLQSWRSWNTTH